ncbi:MAG TPA: glycosyltransferase family 1 protein [Bacteroidales bacterium]|nr:glycosyltransferase family 1 protein [Bacteroidales bacterium]
MKIGFDAKRAFHNRRGLGNYSRDTIRLLSEQLPDNQYFMFTPKANVSLFHDYQSNCQAVLPQSSFYKLCPSLWRTTGICSDIKRHKIDVFHGLSHELPYGIEKLNLHTVVTMHDLIFLKFPSLYPLIDRFLYKKKYKHSCHIADTVIAISEQTKRDLVELFHLNEDKIEVVYQGCNRIFEAEVSADTKEQVLRKYNLPHPFMLQVGAIEKRKNQEIILKAMHIGKIDCPLVLIGSATTYLEELKVYIHEYQLDNRVFILQNVPTADLPALYQSASVFLYPSVFEGFGIPLLEALWSKTPVIAATGSCLEESGGPFSRYVTPHDAENWAAEIENVLNNSDLQSYMTQNNGSHLQQFTDEAIALHLATVYNY